MEFFQLQIFAWGWLYNISNFEIFAPCAKQIGRSHSKKQMTAAKQLFDKAQLFSEQEIHGTATVHTCKKSLLSKKC